MSKQELANATVADKQTNDAQKVLDGAVIIDCINCLHQLISTEPNKFALWQLSDIMRAAVQHNLTIYTTGIGKPGYVAQKQAATMKSIMIDGQFIDATLAGHGDLGSISTVAPSLLIALSKSGRSSELYKLFDAVKSLRPLCSTVLVCMSNDKQFEEVKAVKNIDAIIRFDVNPNELEGEGLVPTTSNVLFEAIMSCALHNACKASFDSIDLYKRLQNSHPSGTLYNKVTDLLAKLRQDNAESMNNDASTPEQPDFDASQGTPQPQA